jgi:hypothetical protein
MANGRENCTVEETTTYDRLTDQEVGQLAIFIWQLNHGRTSDGRPIEHLFNLPHSLWVRIVQFTIEFEQSARAENTPPLSSDTSSNKNKRSIFQASTDKDDEPELTEAHQIKRRKNS